VHTTALAVSADSTLLATGGRDGTLFIWHIETGVRLINLSKYAMQHDGAAVRAIAFNSTGSQVTSVDENGECHLWEPRYTKHLHPKVLRQLVIFASASDLEVAPRAPIEQRFDRYGGQNVDKYLKKVQDFAQSRTPVLRASDGLHYFDNQDATFLSREESVVAQMAAERLQLLRRTNWKPHTTYKGGWQCNSTGKVESGLGVVWSNDSSMVVVVSNAAVRVYTSVAFKGIGTTPAQTMADGGLYTARNKFILTKEVPMQVGDTCFRVVISKCNKFVYIATGAMDPHAAGSSSKPTYSSKLISLDAKVVRELQAPSTMKDGGYGARFSTELYTRGCHCFPRLLRLKRCHAYDQCHSSWVPASLPVGTVHCIQSLKARW
jgi:WD40 repeat protein